MTTVVDATDLRYEYPDGTVAVDGVDFSARRGERVAILGPNGAGKSTLLLLLGGLLDADGGTVEYFGETRSADAVRNRLGVLLQDPDDYLFNPTVREDIEYGPAQMDVPPEVARRRVDELAERLDLAHLLEKPPFRLSGGEKRRAAIASVLSFEPDVLLLDEPVADIDVTYRKRILTLLDELSENGVTVVVSTPDTDLVPEIADRVYLLDAAGNMARTGTTRAVLTDADAMERVGLAPPTLVSLFEDAGVDEVPLTMAEARAALRDLQR